MRSWFNALFANGRRQKHATERISTEKVRLWEVFGARILREAIESLLVTDISAD